MEDKRYVRETRGVKEVQKDVKPWPESLESVDMEELEKDGKEVFGVKRP